MDKVGLKTAFGWLLGTGERQAEEESIADELDNSSPEALRALGLQALAEGEYRRGRKMSPPMVIESYARATALFGLAQLDVMPTNEAASQVLPPSIES